MANLKSYSKEYEFGLSGNSREDIESSCLMRIADATELMAQNYLLLLDKVDSQKKLADKYYAWYAKEQAEKEALKRSIIAHKANYTRLKRKFEVKE